MHRSPPRSRQNFLDSKNSKIVFWCIFESWLWYSKFWRLLGGERCILKGWSWRSILFKTPYLTTFISTKTLYNQMWNICVIVKSRNFSDLENFGDSWRENDASWKIYHGDQCCLKWHFWQLLFRIQSCTIRL